MLFVFGSEFQNIIQGYNPYMKKFGWFLAKQNILSSAKDTVKKTKRQVIFAIPIFHKVFLSKMYKELSRLNKKKTIYFKNKWVRFDQTLHQGWFIDGKQA